MLVPCVVFCTELELAEDEDELKFQLESLGHGLYICGSVVRCILRRPPSPQVLQIREAGQTEVRNA